MPDDTPDQLGLEDDYDDDEEEDDEDLDEAAGTRSRFPAGFLQELPAGVGVHVRSLGE